jgi:hypothetical protein
MGALCGGCRSVCDCVSFHWFGVGTDVIIEMYYIRLIFKWWEDAGEHLSSFPLKIRRPNHSVYIYIFFE